MSAAHSLQHKIYSLEDYLELEVRTGERYNFYNGQVVPMSGGSIDHNLICRNILFALELALGENPDFLVFGSEQKIYLPEFNYYVYPDAVVVAYPPRRSERETNALENAVLIVEVLSHTTERYDRGQKFIEYQSMPTFREYALIRQDKPEVLLMSRTEAATWAPGKASGLEESVHFLSVGVQVELKRIYKDVKF